MGIKAIPDSRYTLELLEGHQLCPHYLLYLTYYVVAFPGDIFPELSHAPLYLRVHLVTPLVCHHLCLCWLLSWLQSEKRLLRWLLRFH